MKKNFLALLAFASFNLATAQHIGIGTNNPHASAQLDVFSTTSGFLLPRLTVGERDAIPTPATGLMIFCTTCGEIQVFNGVRWTNTANQDPCTSVIICGKEWSRINLSVTTYRNGDPIPQVADPIAWGSLTTGAWCYYNNDPATEAAYGKLYNFFAVIDPRGLAPAGWHIPDYTEWTDLRLNSCLGWWNVSGGKVKETGTTHWNTPNTGANNGSFFTALPGGERSSHSTTVNPWTTSIWTFKLKGAKAAFWSSTNTFSGYVATSKPYNTYLTYNSGDFAGETGLSSNDPTFNFVLDNMRHGKSVRLIRD